MIKTVRGFFTACPNKGVYIMSKQVRAVEIVSMLRESASKAEIISRLMSDLPMSKAGATTYYYNSVKILDNPSKKETVKVVSAPKKSKKAVTQETTEKVVEQKVSEGSKKNRFTGKVKSGKKTKDLIPGQFADPNHGPGDGPVRTREDGIKWIKEEEARIDAANEKVAA